jgi:hypothetical protein
MNHHDDGKLLFIHVGGNNVFMSRMEIASPSQKPLTSTEIAILALYQDLKDSTEREINLLSDYRDLERRTKEVLGE